MTVRSKEQSEALGRVVRGAFVDFMRRRLDIEFIREPESGDVTDLREKHARTFDDVEDWERELDMAIGEAVADHVESGNIADQINEAIDALAETGAGVVEAGDLRTRATKLVEVARYWFDQYVSKNTELEKIAGFLRDAGITHAASVADGVLKLIERDLKHSQDAQREHEEVDRLDRVCNQKAGQVIDIFVRLHEWSKAYKTDGIFFTDNNWQQSVAELRNLVDVIFASNTRLNGDVTRLTRELQGSEDTRRLLYRDMNLVCDEVTHLSAYVNVQGVNARPDNVADAVRQARQQVLMIFDRLTELKAAYMKDPKRVTVQDLPSMVEQVRELYRQHEANSAAASRAEGERDKYQQQVGELCRTLEAQTFAGAMTEAAVLRSGVRMLRTIGVNNLEEARGAIVELRGQVGFAQQLRFCHQMLVVRWL